MTDGAAALDYPVPADPGNEGGGSAPVRGILFDLDGTMYRGTEGIPGAGEAVAELRAAGIRCVFASNNPTATSLEYSRRLSSMGIPAAEDDVLTSGGVAAGWLRNTQPRASVFVVGEESLIRELRSAGVQVTDSEQADVVLAAFDRTFSYAKLNTAFQALRRGALFAATNPDTTCPVAGGGLIPDCGGITAALEATSGRKVDVLMGKPSPIMANAALERLGVGAEEALIVGDRLETDIQMGQAAGIRTVLVLSGVSGSGAGPSAASAVLPSVRELPGLLGSWQPAS
ncbi:HAD-IIA family hydrolase [Arthrobacter sp. NPDC055585]